MMYYVATRARSEGVPSTPHSQWDLAEATVAKTMLSVWPKRRVRIPVP
jgi:hypothetical protein